MKAENVIVRDEGFVADDAAEATWLDLAPGDDVTALEARLKDAGFVRIAFASFGDGRGFTMARRLRALGYAGRLRAAGHVLADQYCMARRSGFDEVEIAPALAARQDETQWRARAEWRGGYRARFAAG